MGPEKNKQKNLDDKPLAEPYRRSQVGVSQPNQSSWDTKEGHTIQPPPDAVPQQDPDRQK